MDNVISIARASIGVCDENVDEETKGKKFTQQGLLSKESNWYNLPRDIWEEILPHLSLSNLFRALVVCKTWSLVIFSQCCCEHLSLTNNWDQARHQKPHQELNNIELERIGGISSRLGKERLFIPSIHLGARNMWGSYFPVFVQRHAQQFCVGYQVSLDNWEKLPQFSFLPPSTRGRGCSPFGAAGLLCFPREFSRASRCHTDIIVCNPVSKYWKQLPRLYARHMCFHCTIATQNGERIFKIIGVGRRKWRDTYIYSSDTNSWSSSRICYPVGRYSEESEIQSSAFCNGMLFCVVENLKTLAYIDLEKGPWSELLVNRFLKGYRSLWKVVECKNELYLVVVDKRGQNSHILKLDVLLMEWTLVTHFPEDIFGVYPPGRCDYIHPTKSHCVAYEYKICFALQYDYGKRWHCVVYDITQDSWKKLPRCPFWIKQDTCQEHPNLRHTDGIDYQVVSSVFTPNLCTSLGCS